MKEKMHYISLKIKGGNTYHSNGKRVKLTERIINIGETADCDVRYETTYQQPENIGDNINQYIRNDYLTKALFDKGNPIRITLKGKQITG